MAKVVTFGEIMLRLQTYRHQRIIQATGFDATFGGGEANVAVSLAQFGHDAHYVTKLPANPVGDLCVAELRKYGVNISDITRGGERIGVYYVEKGASQRASTVTYDRKNSAIADASSDDFDWDKIFDGAEWFHFTGITPALSDGCAALCMEALEAAKKHGVKVSCDLNFRKKIW